MPRDHDSVRRIRDRSQTIEALPQIIKQLRARGYRFVTVSELAGLKESQTMPAVHENRDMIRDDASDARHGGRDARSRKEGETDGREDVTHGAPEMNALIECPRH